MQNFFKETKNIKLSTEKKDAIRSNILSYIKAHPLKAKTESPNDFLSFIFMRFQGITKAPLTYALSAITILIVFGGGVITINAESALPGELLYPIKVGVNERVISVLAFTEESKITLNSMLAERRLREVEQLIIQNKFEGFDLVKLSDNFNKKVNKATDAMGKIDSAGNYEVFLKSSTGLEALLRTHQDIISKMSLTQNNSTTSLVDSINETTNKLSKNRATSGGKIIFEAAHDEERLVIIQNKIVELAKEIIRIEEAIKNYKNKLSDDNVSEFNDNIGLAKIKIIQAKNKADWDKDYQASNSLLQEATVITKQSEKIVNEENKLGIDIDLRINQNNVNDSNGINGSNGNSGKKGN